MKGRSAGSPPVGGTSAEIVGLDAVVATHWLLRLACAWCFVGHGAWGIYQKPGWLPFYEVFGIPESIAWPTMPVVGAVDIVLGVLVLFFPCRAMLAWMMFWCVFTALLRPLAGMGWWEFLERGGNYAPPIAFLILSLAQPGVGWLGKIKAEAGRLGAEIVLGTRWALRLGIALLLIGHGGFGAFEARPMLLDHWASIGVVLDPIALRAIGWGEILAGCAVLLVDSTPLWIAVTVWKIGTELLYPIAGSAMDIFEWIERGGDYFAPLALIALGAITPGRAHDP